jgi:putative ABC transport system permease protein
MSIRARLASLFRNILLRKRVEQDLDDELRSYLEMVADERRDLGMTDDDARRVALVELGGVEQVRESVRAARAGALLDQLHQDFIYAFRLLGRHRGFTTVAVATLALGIGANTAIFSIVDTVVFRPMPYADPERLVKVWGSNSPQPVDNVSFPDFVDIRDQNDVFEWVAADDAADESLWPSEGPRQFVDGAQVTGAWLATLGVQPILGRTFVPSDEVAGNDHVVVLTHSYWTHRFAADPNILGRTMVSRQNTYTIVGVLPPNVLRYGNDFLKPLVAAEYSHDRGHRDLDVFARLKNGVTIAQAQTQLQTIARRLEREYPATNQGRAFSVAPLGKYYTLPSARANRALMLMFGAVGLVLLLACVNVANLLLARAVTRSRECVIRAALGAGRARLVRQMLVESVLLFLFGGSVGLLLARWSVDSLVALAVAGGYVPERLNVSVDTRVLLFTGTASLIAGLLFGLVPALQSSKVDLNDSLRGSTSSSSGGLRRRRASHVLIVSELAISFVLLVGCGLMVRSFLRLQASSAGINPENLLETQSDGGRSFPEAFAFWRAVLDRVRLDPGVLAAAVSSRPPVHGARRLTIAVEGQASSSAGHDPQVGDILVSEEYFPTMGIPLVKGRAFSAHDTSGSPPAVIVSESFARKFFSDGNVIGKRVKLFEQLPMTCCTAAAPIVNVWREIVGIAADVRQANLDDSLAMTVYRPYSQILEHDMYLMVRARSAPDSARLETRLRSELLAIDPSKAWADVRPMRDVISQSESIRLRRFVLTVLGIFAILAVVLAAVGTYGVMAHAVADRTREIGIRVALGATRPQIINHVLADTAALTVAGLVVGWVGAWALTRLMTSMLFGITATDAVTYFGVSGLLAAVALLASYVPSRRATQVDPLLALRQE